MASIVVSRSRICRTTKIDSGTTLTSRMTSVAGLPAVSLTLYVTWYMPSIFTSKPVVSTITLPATSPSTLSVATKPGSMYGEPMTSSSGLAPFSMITGASVSGPA